MVAPEAQESKAVNNRKQMAHTLPLAPDSYACLSHLGLYFGLHA